MDVPWTRLHIDYAGPLNGHYYLIIMDSFSKWPEILMCRHPISTNTVTVSNELFSLFSVPKTLVSNNRTQFTGRGFKNFCTSLSMDHVTTSVYHPRSNGLVKRSVNTFKRSLRKNQGMDTDERSIQKFLVVYRITPNPNRFRPFNSWTDVCKKNSVHCLIQWKKVVKGNFVTKFYKSEDSFLQKLFRWKRLLGSRSYH